MKSTYTLLNFIYNLYIYTHRDIRVSMILVTTRNAEANPQSILYKSGLADLRNICNMEGRNICFKKCK